MSQTRLHGEHAVDLGTDGSAATGAGTRGAWCGIKGLGIFHHQTWGFTLW